jgi:hypothetical protein
MLPPGCDTTCVALRDVTHGSVRSAMQEFDELGRDRFLERYGFGRAREYFVIEGGRRYDSKALVGAAHGREPGRSPLRPSDFSGGDQTVAAHLGRLGFRVSGSSRDGNSAVRGVETSGWRLAVGQTIRRTQLHKQYGGSRQDGVSPSRLTPNVLIFTDPASGEQHGYFDRWREDGVFYYTGRGQRGNQQFTSGNRAILNHVQDGRALRLFKGARGTVMYAGRFELADEEPWIYEQAPATGGGSEREVIVFRLLRVLEDGPAPEPRMADRGLGRPFNLRDETVAPAMAASRDPDVDGRGLRAHRRIENELASAVRAHGFEPCDPPVEGPAYDLAWIDRDCLTVCEVKSLTRANQAGQIRLGLGQVLDYAFTLRERRHSVRPVLAVEHEPESAYWSRLCREHGVALVWPSGFDKLWSKPTNHDQPA